MWQRWAGGGENERRSRQAAGRLMSGAGRLMPVRGSADSRVCREHADESLREVALTAAAVENWEEYGTVFIGYPIWWGIAAWPVDGFVTGNDFTGKTVIPFCTSASSPLDKAESCWPSWPVPVIGRRDTALAAVLRKVKLPHGLRDWESPAEDR